MHARQPQPPRALWLIGVLCLLALGLVAWAQAAQAATPGTITTVAGGGDLGGLPWPGDGGPATQAQLWYARDVAGTGDGGFLVVDGGNSRIRRVAPDGTITTVAGNGLAPSGDLGDGGPATQARLSFPTGVAATGDGGFLVADQGNHRIRRVAPNGTISTVAGNGLVGLPTDVGDGGPATQASLNSPSGVAVTADGGFLIADKLHERIRRVMPDGTITTVAGTSVAGCYGDGGPAIQAGLGFPSGVAVTPDGGFLIADTGTQRIRRVTADGTITTVAGSGDCSPFGGGFSGDGGPATEARLSSPAGVAATALGGFLIADTMNDRVRRVAGTDVTAPVVSVPTDGPTVDATSPAGAAVSFTVTATDETDGALTPTCAPPSGSVFAIGTTTVSCSATDHSGNMASATFPVTVKGAAAPPPTALQPPSVTVAAPVPPAPKPLNVRGSLRVTEVHGTFRVVSLRLSRLTPGSRVVVRCLRGCSLQKTFVARSRSKDLTGLLRGRLIPVGSVISVRVTRAGALGRYFRWAIKEKGLVTTRCQVSTRGKLVRCTRS